MTSQECFITEVLKCGTSDLFLLDELYSDLADEVMWDEWVNDNIRNYNATMDELIYTLYKTVRNAVMDKLREIKNEEYTSQKTKDCIDEIIDNILIDPYPNYLDSKFDSDLDQVIDWKGTVESNAMALIDYSLGDDADD